MGDIGPDTRTVWEQTGRKPIHALGDIIPCESALHRFHAIPAVDRWEHRADCPLHLCADCSIRMGAHLKEHSWKRISAWSQPT